MIVAVADTHAAVWYLFNDPKLLAVGPPPKKFRQGFALHPKEYSL